MTDPVQKTEENKWIWEDGKMIKKQITFTPLIYQIVEEILISAASGGATIVKVKIEDAIVKVSSDGGGLPDLRDSHFALTEFEAEKVEHGKVTKWSGSEQLTINNENLATPKSTMVSFIPDSKCLQDDTLALIKRRVVDLAGCCSGVKVELEGTHCLPRTFQEYVQLYLETVTHDTRMIYEKVDDKWEICVAIGDGCFEQVTFLKDGSHVDHITNQITTYVANILQLEPSIIQRKIWVFVNAPTFYSTRDNVRGSSESECQLSVEFLMEIAKSHLQNDQLTVSKLSDAPLANTLYAEYATLIVVEGDSATSFPMSGLSVLGASKYGVFPVSGKLLNARKATPAKVNENVELQNIKKILGLKDKKVYNDDNFKELRYGHLMIMADQDRDGIHIKGLLINFIELYWPSLLTVEGFLKFFITPIIKATHHEDNSKLFFYTIDQYHAWTGNMKKQYAIKYYKGLASIEKEEGKEFFKESHNHIKDVVSRGEECNIIRQTLELLFCGKKADDRKEWVNAPGEPQDNFDPKKTTIYMVDFLQKDYKQFAQEFLFRSLPSSIDGFKPTQRRVFYGASETLVTTECMAVDEFAGHVARLTAYYHGIDNLVDVTLRMCRDYVGTNNINLILPVGQVGSQKEIEESRYCSTKLSRLTEYIFHKADKGVLKYLEALGQRVEPQWFIPIIPMLLVNGCHGIGFGYKSDILNYSPREIIRNLQLKLDDIEPLTMIPWFKSFEGNISNISDTTYKIDGEIILDSPDALTFRITKVGLTTKEAYQKEFLESAAPDVIQGYTVCNDNSGALFEVTMTQYQMTKARKVGILNKLKLSTTKNIRHMNVFDENGILRKHDTPVLLHFFKVRLDYYSKRRSYMLHNLKKDELILKNKLEYIEQLVNGLSLVKLSMNEKIAKLKASGLQSIT